MTLFHEKLMVLNEVLSGIYQEWQGLDPNLPLVNLKEELLPIADIRGPEELTRTYQRFNVTHFSRPVPPEEVDAWCVVGQGAVSILEYADPPMRDLEGTLQQYGPPELVLTDQRYAVGMRVQDYLYASRGICISIGEPFPPAPTYPRRAVYLQLFPASSVQFYLTDIGSGVATKPNVLPEVTG
jgi:hypothetical protein